MDFENRDYDLALFHIEQFAQLYSKNISYTKELETILKHVRYSDFSAIW